MTWTSMNLTEAVGKRGDEDLRRQLAATAVARSMEFEVEQ